MKYILLFFFITFSAITLANVEKEKAQKMRDVAQETKVLIEDVVYKLIKTGDDHKVLFAKHAGIYYLRANSKHHKSILGALESSQKSGETVQLKADAYSLDIEELVLNTK